MTRARILGILNLTPDSFFAASRTSPGDVVSAAENMLAEGAWGIDLGAVSTRPGSSPVSEQEEWARLEPALASLRDLGCVLSVDTFRSGIVSRVYDTVGPFMVNDITAGAFLIVLTARWRLGAGKRLSIMPQENENEIRYFHIMEGVGINSETKICQYLDLEYLMKILNEESYYVKRKKFFVDDREKDFPELLRFGLEPMDPEYRKDHAAEIAKRQAEWDKSVSQYKKQSYLLTSCWTVRTMENILMWDRSFAPSFSARAKALGSSGFG